MLSFLVLWSGVLGKAASSDVPQTETKGQRQ